MVHDGPFDDLDQTYGALGTVVAELGLGVAGPDPRDLPGRRPRRGLRGRVTDPRAPGHPGGGHGARRARSDDLDQTYGALGTTVAELGLGTPGPIREIYLADDRAEVCWPITQGDTT